MNKREAGIVLHGGPMDGWVVAPDAAALRADWYRTLPSRPRSFASVLLRRPVDLQVLGRYVLDLDAAVPSATWHPLPLGEV
jgi:hypothetical protein